MYRSFVALQVLDATKTPFAQHLTGLKCYFHLLNNFLYAIQAHYEKNYKNVFVLETQNQFFGLIFTILKNT